MSQPRSDDQARPRPSTGGRVPELLAPAGDAGALEAALRSGADAVYFGLQEGFNARARAGNFSLEDLAPTVDRIHGAGARAYLTLNTLVFEPELAAAAALVRRATSCGLDALLVQDPAVALLARAVAPGLEIHASTQMTISSPAAAAFAEQLGASRVILPRELSVREIGAMVQGTRLEVEVFVHGALCISWSGQCLSSEAWSGRSANRGQCAQSCRMPYDLLVDGEDHDPGEVRYPLSPKDLAGWRAVPDLAALGVRALKIEGRQKGAQYVATAVAGYRRRLDALAAGGAAKAPALARMRDDLVKMSLSFSRGFCPGFLAGPDHQTLVEGRFPKHRGVHLGRVARVDAQEVLVEPWPRQRPRAGGGVLVEEGEFGPAALDVRPGMGVVFDAGDPEDKHEPGGPVFRVTRQGKNLLLGFGRPGPDLGRVRPGQRVWVTSDPTLVRDTARLLARDVPVARLPLSLRVQGALGARLRLIGRVPGREVAVETPSLAQEADGPGLTRHLLEEKLGALGGTPFVLETLDVSGLGLGLHIPVSELKAARRRLVAALGPAAGPRSPAADLADRWPEPLGADSDVIEELRRAARVRWRAFDPDPAPRLIALCRSEAQLEAAIEAGLPEVELDWMEMTGLGRAVGRAREAGLHLTLSTLRVQKPGEEGLDDRLARLEPDGILVRHWGGLMRFASLATAGAGPRLHGDFSLNVTNSLAAAHVLGCGLDTFTPAHDLDAEQLLALLDQVPAERVTIVVQHRIATFHTEHCVYAHLLSDGRDYRDCGRPCDRHTIALRDHLRQAHPVIVDAACRNTVFDAEAQSAAALVPRLLERGVRRFRVEFVRESRLEAAAVLGAYTELVAGRTTPEALRRALRVRAQQGLAAGGMTLLLRSGAGAAPPARRPDAGGLARGGDGG